MYLGLIILIDNIKVMVNFSHTNIPGDKGPQDPASHAVGLSCFRGDVSSPGEVGVDVDTQVFDVVRPLEWLA